jgi:hypothetical protein
MLIYHICTDPRTGAGGLDREDGSEGSGGEQACWGRTKPERRRRIRRSVQARTGATIPSCLARNLTVVRRAYDRLASKKRSKCMAKFCSSHQRRQSLPRRRTLPPTRMSSSASSRSSLPLLHPHLQHLRLPRRRPQLRRRASSSNSSFICSTLRTQ